MSVYQRISANTNSWHKRKKNHKENTLLSQNTWPSIVASDSIPLTPQPTTPKPAIIVVWESVPTTLTGYRMPFV